MSGARVEGSRTVRRPKTKVMAEIDTSMQEQRRLERELRELHARLAAFESSRWWRLHPRFVLRRLRGSEQDELQQAARDPRDDSLPDDFTDADAELWRRIAPYTMTTPGKVHALTRAVEYIVARRIPGAFVECGVWRGGSMMAVALTLLRLKVTDRDLYLFDTFEGMPEPGEEDVKQGGEPAADVLARLDRGSAHWAIASIEEVREVLFSVGYPRERIHLVPGKVEETLPDGAPGDVALLRLDTDWYASTRHELVHLYPRLVAGGVLIIDDYAYWRGARQAVDEYVRENEPTLFLIRIDHGARVALKP
jgi:O-methyltransferase